MLISNWINSRAALGVSKSYPKGVGSIQALIWAGQKGGFARKSPDGFHWEFEENKVRRYCEIAEFSLLSIAKQLDTNIGVLKYLALNHGIKFKIELGRKYISKEDRDLLIKLFKEKNNG
jgi:hypothetical protein